MKKYFVLFFYFTCVLFSQTEDYFPAHIGDTFEYESREYGFEQTRYFKTTITNVVSKSSGGIDIYYDNSTTPRYLKATDGNIYRYDDNKPVLWFVLNTDSIDTFYTTLGGTPVLVDVTHHYGVTMFNIKSNSIDFVYYDKSKLLFFGKINLCDGFGIIYNYSNFYLPSENNLVGCVINDKAYGSLVDVRESSTSLPDEFILSQNYPNPFNPSTTIEYTIPGGVETLHATSLRVYDVLGREVATLVNEVKPAGSYSVTFNVKTLHGTSLPSGIYFYHLRAGDYFETKKMVLIK